MTRKVDRFETDIDAALPKTMEGIAGKHLRPMDTNRWLTECFWLEFECSRMTMGWAPAVPDWDMKGQLIRMSYLHTQHAKHLRDRIHELPGGRIGERAWTPEIVREACERLSTAPALPEFAASYQYLVGKLFNQYDQLKRLIDPILDAPTIERLRWIELDREELLAWSADYTRFPYEDDKDKAERYTQWQHYIHQVWQIAGGTGGEPGQAWPAHPVEAAAGPVPKEAAVDPRFPHFQGEYPSAMYDPTMPTYDSVKQIVYINATEMTSAESLAYLYYGVQRMPFDFYYDVARHTWDEVRHSQMGVRRLRQWGYRTEQFGWQPVHVPDPTTMKTAFPEFYAGLTMIAEACSFTKKRKSADAFWKFGDTLSAVQSEFDLADERIHVELGKKWGAKLFEHMDDFETAKAVEEKVRRRRLENMSIPDEEIKGLLKNFPQLCGFTTTSLAYNKY